MHANESFLVLVPRSFGPPSIPRQHDIKHAVFHFPTFNVTACFLSTAVADRVTTEAAFWYRLGGGANFGVLGVTLWGNAEQAWFSLDLPVLSISIPLLAVGVVRLAITANHQVRSTPRTNKATHTFEIFLLVALELKGDVSVPPKQEQQGGRKERKCKS